MKFYKPAFWAMMFLFFVQQTTGCKEPITDYDREKVRLDSLKGVLISIEAALNVDEKELQQRISIVDSWYIRLSDTTYDVAKKMQVDFNGFKVVYKRYVDDFFQYTTALGLHKQQYNKLEERVKKQELTRSDFKVEYEKLSEKVKKTQQSVNKIAKPVYDLELSWRRHEKVMEAMGSKRR